MTTHTFIRIGSWLSGFAAGGSALAQPGAGWQFDRGVDRDALPTVPAGFEVSLFAREPWVRQPCSMAFDAEGRLFVGMGPQYRSPKSDTPGDSVVLVLDADGDGKADRTQIFAAGFNAIQGLAWQGRDLWVANAPDLTVVRDLDGDNDADEYARVYTDLGNLEHGLHGLNWAPDGKFSMSKGNSKGLTEPGRIAPKPFRDLWGVTARADTPDFPPPRSFTKDGYRKTYHDPEDDRGREGGDGFRVTETADRLRIAHSGKQVGEYVFRDPRILRPYLANLHAPDGSPVTRNHPPIPGVDATDHDTMHPGLWLAFGDISGQDFWRNRGRIEHVRFLEPPSILEGRLSFVTENRLKSADGQALCGMTNRLTLHSIGNAWQIVWEATFRSEDADLTFGDQEEMGFGARVATSLTEKNGGRIVSSTGKASARATWGQPAEWCDYSGRVGDKPVGITLLADPANFRSSWWHNRDYGVFVANPFGRAAMKQGDTSAVTVRRGETFRLCFGAVVHHGPEFRPAAAFESFLGTLTRSRGSP